MHNYNERGTFKIYRSFVFGEANFPMECGGTGTLASKSLGDLLVPLCVISCHNKQLQWELHLIKHWNSWKNNFLSFTLWQEPSLWPLYIYSVLMAVKYRSRIFSERITVRSAWVTEHSVYKYKYELTIWEKQQVVERMISSPNVNYHLQLFNLSDDRIIRETYFVEDLSVLFLSDDGSTTSGGDSCVCVIEMWCHNPHLAFLSDKSNFKAPRCAEAVGDEAFTLSEGSLVQVYLT